MDYESRIGAWNNAITNCVKTVWRQYHGGLLEGVYQDVMSIELESLGCDAPTEVDIPMFHKGKKLKHHYRADMIVCDEVLVEFKAVKELLPEHRFQLYNYMRLTKMPFGMLINFGLTQYTIERWMLDLESNQITPYKK
ncbi:MAG: GxxExxY protein [Prevotellaceae bacterium]|nr:GxxExxY protein [Candidatus Minthosoma caballi]